VEATYSNTTIKTTFINYSRFYYETYYNTKYDT